MFNKAKIREQTLINILKHSCLLPKHFDRQKGKIDITIHKITKNNTIISIIVKKSAGSVFISIPALVISFISETDKILKPIDKRHIITNKGKHKAKAIEERSDDCIFYFCNFFV